MLDLVQVLAGACGDLEPIVRFIANGIYPVIQLGIPIILIIMGSIDLGRAVLSSDDKEIKGATSKLIKRAIAAVAVFFVATIVSVLMGMFTSSGSGVEGTTNWSACWKEVRNS